MSRATRSIWTRRVKEWGESGQTAQEYASSIGVSVSTLKQWKYRLDKEQRLQNASDTETITSKNTFSFVELGSRAVFEERFEIEMPSGVKVRVPQTFDPLHLKSIILALG